MPKLFIYLRVSTDDKGQDPENQLADCLAYAYEHKLIEVEGDARIWREEAGAWGKTTRPVFDEMMSQAWRKKVPALLVWDYDRLYRDRKKTVETIKNYGLAGTKILSVRQEWLQRLLEVPPPFNELFYDFMLQIVAWMAEDESKRKSDRMKACYKKKKAGREQYGLSVIWGRKPISREVVDAVLAHKRSDPQLSVRKLAAMVSSELGASVRKSTVQKILSVKASSENPPLKEVVS